MVHINKRLTVSLGVAVLVTLLAAAPASAAAPPPTVSIQDGGDGYINGAEEGAVMLTGTYSLLAVPPITAITARIVSDELCAELAPTTPTLTATMFLDGTWTAGPFSLAAFPQGFVCARAQAHDMSGPGGTGTSAPKIKDTIAPASGTVNIDDGGDGRISASEAAAGVPISWNTLGDGDNAEISFEDSLPSTPASCVFVDSPDSSPGATIPGACLNDLSEGTITMRGVWLDQAGNRSSIASDSSILDALPPALGTVTLADPNSDGYANKEEVQSGKTVGAWTNADADASASKILFRDAFGAIHSPECGPFANPANGFHTLTQACANKMAQGPFEFAVSWSDLAGNITPEVKDSLILDTIDPSLAIIEPIDGSFQPPTVHVRGTTDPSTRLIFRMDGGPAIIGVSGADGTFERVFSGLSNGPHFIAVTAIDVASNSIALGASFIVDDLIPYIRNPIRDTNHPEIVAVNGTGRPDSNVQIWEGDTLIGRAEVSSVGEWQVTIAMDEGAHTIRARATDTLGAPTSAFGPERTFRVIPRPPQVSIDTADMALNPLQITGAATAPKGVDRVHVQYFDALGGGLLFEADADCNVCGPGQTNVGWIHTVPERLSIDLIRVEATAYDEVGQASTRKSIRFVYYFRL